MRLGLPSPALLPALLATAAVPPPALAEDKPPGAEEVLVALYRSGDLFDPRKSDAVRAAFTRLFEERHAQDIKEAYGDDHAKLAAWLDARPQVKQKFYTALDERYDRVPEALRLFKEVWRQFPKEVEAYDDLAVALAVTWDDERHGVYDYTGHQRRTKSVLPGERIDALGNFRYLVENEEATEGRVKLLPWEFLTFVIDHRTPLSERAWAQEYYRSSRGRVQSWHRDVPYDDDMLKGEKTKDPRFQPRLKDREYTLANVHKYGGVCTHQADFACRVAKSVGIPAVYCFGESSYRGLHAWWMFVQVQGTARDRVRFALVSDGRIAGFLKDQFYTGFVTDPQSGRRILDRDMERRLKVTGLDPAGKRHADLLMRAYPWLGERMGFSAAAKVDYLDRVLRVSKYNGDAWQELARMVRDGELGPRHKRAVLARLTVATKTFLEYPDFLHPLLKDLLAVEPDPRERARFYESAVALYEKLGRPDLACDARLTLAELHLAQSKHETAVRGLTQTVRKFPTEGRYVPDLLRALEKASAPVKNGNLRTAALYLELVPGMITYYGGAEEEYPKKLYEQALKYLREQGLDKYADSLKAQADAAVSRP